jgi:hypothetical protein
MTLRRGGRLGGCDARTHGASISVRYGCDRGRSSALPRRPRRHKASFRNAFGITRLAFALALLSIVLTAPAAASAQLPRLRAGFSPQPSPRLTEQQALALFLADKKVADWLDRYPPDRSSSATFDRARGQWKAHVWWGEAGEIATGRVDDASGTVVESWTGPQVAWKMARGGYGAFGGKVLDSAPVWFGLCGVFLLGLADLRRPLSLRNLDLLVLISFSASLWFFNRGEIFTSVPLAYPPLVYLLARTAWIGFRRRALPASRPLWPVWVLAAATVFLAGFRIGLNVEAPRGVIDVGLASVVGADRILDGQAPYGHMPVRGDRPPCGKADADGDIRERVQTNGRCEAAVETGDTYGPSVYLAYLPATAVFGWSGRWDSLPAAHATAIAFDLLTMLGLVLVGRRLGGTPLAVTLAFGWAAFPFTAYTLNSNSNDAVMPAALVWGFWLASSPWARGGAAAIAGWAKFGALLVAPLWALYPGPRASVREADEGKGSRGPRSGLSAERTSGGGLGEPGGSPSSGRDETGRFPQLVQFAVGFGAATVALFSILLLEPNLIDALRTFGRRTLEYQFRRESPFSLWDWGQYHARGIPNLSAVQTLLQVGVLLLAGVAATVPRRKGPLELAALTAALLLAFELVLTHWFYLYLPWLLPFVLLALFLQQRDAYAAA